MRPLEKGAGKAGCAAGTRSLACKSKKHTSSSPQVPRNTRPSLHDGFNGFLRALPGDEFLLSPSPADEGFAKARSGRLASADLTPATGARTTRLHRPQRPSTPKASPDLMPDAASAKAEQAPFVRALCDHSRAENGPPCNLSRAPDAAASTASHPASVTIAIRPSEGWNGGGDGGDLGKQGS